jgi:hypothetical protein
MRVEGHHGSCAAAFFCGVNGCLDDFLVADMEAVEDADSEMKRAGKGAKFAYLAEHVHGLRLRAFGKLRAG